MPAALLTAQTSSNCDTLTLLYSYYKKTLDVIYLVLLKTRFGPNWKMFGATDTALSIQCISHLY